MTPEPAAAPMLWTVAAQLAGVLESGVVLDFTADAERPTFSLPPGTRVLVAPLLEDEATRLCVQTVLGWCVAYRRALLAGDQQAQVRWLDTLGLRLARSVRAAIEVSR